MGFDFLFAVTEIVIGNEGDNYALHVATRQFKGLAIIVQFIRILPAHAIFALTLAGIIKMRQAQSLFAAMNQMRR